MDLDALQKEIGSGTAVTESDEEYDEYAERYSRYSDDEDSGRR
jgi:hypothetical protein